MLPNAFYIGRSASRLLRCPTKMAATTFTATFHSLPKYPSHTVDHPHPLHSGESLQLIRSSHQHHLDQLNGLVRGTPLESKPLYEVMRSQAGKAKKSVLTFNHASQAFNIHFYISGLAAEATTPNEEVMRNMNRYFNGFENFKEEFKNHALGIFGSGWTWLVVNAYGEWLVMNTYNGGTPFTFPYHPRHSATSKLDSPLTLRGGNSYQDLFLKDDDSEKAVTSQGECYQDGEVIPLLNLSVWEHAYIGDYQLNREAYVEQFFKSIDWEVVGKRIPHPSYFIHQ